VGEGICEFLGWGRDVRRCVENKGGGASAAGVRKVSSQFGALHVDYGVVACEAAFADFKELEFANAAFPAVDDDCFFRMMC
jgi:hypothetical protein